MTIQKLASLIAEKEGKKTQARIGDIREILKCIATIEAEDRDDFGISGDSPIHALEQYADKLFEKVQDRREKAERKKEKADAK